MKSRSSFLAIATVPIWAFFATPTLGEDTPTAKTVLVEIDGTAITVGHMLALRSSLPPHYAQLSEDVLFDGILDQLIQQVLLAQSLESGPSLRARLLIENETRAITAGEVIDSMMSGEISEEELKEAYQSEYVEAEIEKEYNASHILVATKEEADDLVKKLADGADFAALAREFSTGPSGDSGGALGWFGAGVMVAPFFDAVAMLNVGEVSDPVETQFGWHVIKLIETRTQDIPSFDEVREALEQDLRSQKFEDHVKKLESAANINRIAADKVDHSLVNKVELLEE